MTLAELERIGIEAALASTDFNLNEAARILGMSRTTLFRRVKEYGLRKKPLERAASAEPMALAELESAAIDAALARAQFNVSEAARLLGIGRTTMIRKVNALGLRESVALGRAAEEEKRKEENPPARAPAIQRRSKAKLARGGCLSCGGVVQPMQGPDRVYSYRGRVKVKIPDDFPVDTCVDCGAIYMDRKAHDDLERRIEQRVREAKMKSEPSGRLQNGSQAGAQLSVDLEQGLAEGG